MQQHVGIKSVQAHVSLAAASDQWIFWCSLPPSCIMTPISVIMIINIMSLLLWLTCTSTTRTTTTTTIKTSTTTIPPWFLYQFLLFCIVFIFYLSYFFFGLFFLPLRFILSVVTREFPQCGISKVLSYPNNHHDHKLPVQLLLQLYNN